MKHTAQDILNYVEDNDVKFVRLAFCDIFGNQKKHLCLCRGPSLCLRAGCLL